MPNAFQIAGAQSPPSEFAPLYTASIFSGLITNRNWISEGTVPAVYAKMGYGRQDSILYGSNSEISSHLTLKRRPGLSVHNANIFPPITRYYAFNGFSFTNETVRVLADTITGGTNGTGTVYDLSGGGQTVIFQKSAGAGKTYFLGLGNILYFTNGVDNKQVTFYPDEGTWWPVELLGVWGPVTGWGIAAPPTAPTVTQAPRPSPYLQWQPNVFYGYPLVFDAENYVMVVIIEGNNLYYTEGGGTTAATPPTFSGSGGVTDGSIGWTFMGPAAWGANTPYSANARSVVAATVNGMLNTFLCISGNANSSATPPYWPASGSVQDGPLVWQNIGLTAVRSNPTTNQPSVGSSRIIPLTAIILDSNGYVQQIAVPGVSGTTVPNPWQTLTGAYTIDNGATWVNVEPYSVAATAPTQYGYAYQNSDNTDISNMSPASVQITQINGNEIIVKGVGSADKTVTTIVLYRTAQGGSTFLFVASFPNPGGGVSWTYTDTIPDSGLNPEIQALVDGEGTPLPAGASCLAYHCGRIWAAVGNVLYGSSGPDAIVAGSSGNSGFDTTFTLQAKIIRLWVTSIGMIIFTVRDAYILLGNGAPAAAGGTAFYVTTYIENLPLLSYDAFTTLNTTAYMMTGKQMLLSLDPGAGIVEMGQPIAEELNTIDPANAYVTFHSQVSQDTALYVSDGSTKWLRMAPTSPPESGFNWSPPATPVGGMSCLQSVETSPGTYQLLMGPKTSGPILTRDLTVNTDNGTAYIANAAFGVLTLAHTGQLAGLAWMTLESLPVGTAPALAVLIDELTGTPENVPRTRQDPPNLAVSKTLRSDRHSMLQNQRPVWCKHLLFEISWPAEDAANELISFAIFGETWNEMRTQ